MVRGGGGRRLGNNVVSAFLVFNRSFHVVKCVCKVAIAILSAGYSIGWPGVRQKGSVEGTVGVRRVMFVLC
jgi:hypothetical protein